MTTKDSPPRRLRAQAGRMAALLKAVERGARPDVPHAEKLLAARQRETTRFGIAMDDKIISIEMAWSTIAATDEAALAEFIVAQMRETRATAH